MFEYEKRINWNLKELFENDNDFYIEIDKINEQLNEIVNFKNINLDSNNLLMLLNSKWELKEKANRVLIYGSLNYYKNIDCEETKRMKKISEQLVSKVDSTASFIDEKILELGSDKVELLISENEKMNIYKLYIKNLFRKKEHVQDEKTNSIIKESNDTINEYLTTYNNIIHKIDLGTINIDGQNIKLLPSNVSKYLSSRNRETRKDTYISLNTAYQEYKDSLADILNSIYKNRVNISELEHYSSVLEKNLFDENINPDIITTLMKSVEENLPLIHDYLNIKSNFLSIDDPHLYDYGVPFDNGIKKKYSLEDAVVLIKEALLPLGKEYLDVIDYLLDNHHIDAVLDENKHQSITFSWSSYCFMNYREAYINLKNLVHEIGHIVNAYLSEKKQPYIYADSTVFVGETASLVNEILLNRYLLEHAETDDERLFYLSGNIENYFVQVFKQTMYTEFENKLYGYVQNKVELTSRLLESEYSKLQKKYFGEFTTYDECSSIEWARLGHLYRWSYYVYKYATGLIMASSVANGILNNKEGLLDKYLNFLSSGSNAYSLDLLKEIEIDLTNPDNINNSFELLENDISEFNKVLLKK